jgi:hypothetical protein
MERKMLLILVCAVYALLLLFYLGLIVPEYAACVNCMYEGQKGIDIWGSEIDCSGENQAVGEAMFKFFSIIVGGSSLVMVATILWIRRSQSKGV